MTVDDYYNLIWTAVKGVAMLMILWYFIRRENSDD